MANETKEIGDIVKKCKILLLDIEGTTTSISFVKDKLFPYAEEHVQKFLETEWEKEEVKEAVGALRKLALEDQENKVDGVVTIPGEDASKDEQIAGLVGNVKWQMSADRKAGPLKQLQGLIWKQGYDNGDIKGHVYDDVAAALEQWRSTDGQKVYIYSSGSVQAQKLLFGQSLAGDLLPRIDGHFDTAVGPKQEAASYTAIAEKIEAKPEEILFLTDIVKEAEAALAAGIHAALVSREGNAPLPETEFPIIHSFAQLTSNKRKPGPQEDEEMPAKVPKTDAEKDVKETAEAASAAAAEEPKQEEQATMEVEAEAPVVSDKPVPVEEPVKVVTAIEEITDSNEAVDATMTDVEPVVEEENKTEEETEKPAKPDDGESDKKEKDVEMENGESAPVAEETPPASGPVIEELDGKLDDVADIVDEIQPVVEEPPVVEDMEVLQNVGEVLEKECDEILSKVQDVTNLDSIPVKPLLNPIAEETMETENTDSNDIVDRILDTELELEMKQNEILNSETAGEGNENKQENVVKDETDIKETNGIEDKIADEIVESNKKEEDSSSMEATSEVKPEESSAMETQVEEKQTMETPVEEKQTMDTLVEEKQTMKTLVEEKQTAEAPATESKESPVEPIKEMEAEETPEKTIEESKTAEENKPEPESPIEESKPVEENPVEENPVKESSVENTPATETQPADSKPADEQKETETSKPEESSSEPQMNGKATNGDAPATNGTTEDGLCSRLPVVNGKTENGSNSDSMDAEQGQGDSKVEEIADIKVKTVPAVEPTAPTEQPTEA